MDREKTLRQFCDEGFRLTDQGFGFIGGRLLGASLCHVQFALDAVEFWLLDAFASILDDGQCLL